MDFTALRDGSLLELVNLIHWHNITLSLPASTLRRIAGPHKAVTELLEGWLAHVRGHQAARVLEGATPVAGIVKLAQALHQLGADAVALPAAVSVWLFVRQALLHGASCCSRSRSLAPCSWPPCT